MSVGVFVKVGLVAPWPAPTLNNLPSPGRRPLQTTSLAPAPQLVACDNRVGLKCWRWFVDPGERVDMQVSRVQRHTGRWGFELPMELMCAGVRESRQ